MAIGKKACKHTLKSPVKKLFNRWLATTQAQSTVTSVIWSKNCRTKYVVSIK